MLTELDKEIIASIQGEIAITKRPYLEIAEKLGIDEELLLERMKDLCDRGVIRRFGATIRHQQSGFEANAMVAWKVDEDRIDAVGEKMASFNAVSMSMVAPLIFPPAVMSPSKNISFSAFIFK